MVRRPLLPMVQATTSKDPIFLAHPGAPDGQNGKFQPGQSLGPSSAREAERVREAAKQTPDNIYTSPAGRGSPSCAQVSA